MEMCAINTFLVQWRKVLVFPMWLKHKINYFHPILHMMGHTRGIQSKKQRPVDSRALQMMFISYFAMTTEELTERAKGSPHQLMEIYRIKNMCPIGQGFQASNECTYWLNSVTEQNEEHPQDIDYNEFTNQKLPCQMSRKGFSYLSTGT